MPKTSQRRNPVAAPTAAPDTNDEFLTAEETARRLKRSPKVLEYWRLVGQGPPFYRQGRVIRYLLSEVMAWGASQRVAGRDSAVQDHNQTKTARRKQTAPEYSRRAER